MINTQNNNESFIPFKPISENLRKEEDQNKKEDKNKKNLQKGINAKYAFIEKYNLIELKSDVENDNFSYYYDNKSKTVFEINNFGPIVFMKSNLEMSKHLIKLNDDIT